MKHSLILSLGLAVLASITLALPASATVNINWVTVGDVNNPNDPLTGYGSVDHAYKIAQNDTTISQYCEFLNAVAKSDPHALYNLFMTYDAVIAGISRSGSSGSYSYAVIGTSGNKPITYVSWYDAARFCNWMQNGQGGGSTETGAYTLNGAMAGIILKNSNATVWIPSENEWYKAAYYDPTKGGSNYWLYPTRSDTLAGNTIGVAHSANCWNGSYATNPAGLTDVGAYGANSASHYGTNDQGGNVWQWNDAAFSNSSRGLRGGSWANSGPNLASSDRTYTYPYGDSASDENSDFGFRVVSVAAPSAATLPASAISGTSATLNGSVNANGGTTTVSFQYGLTSAYGSTITASPASVTGTFTTAVSASISGLLLETTYHFRVVATSAGGTTYGADTTFTTLDDGDGYDNLIEYAFNLSPANGVGSPFSINPSTVSTGRVELSFTRPTGATASVTYYLEYSSALGPATSWISIPLTNINPRNITITPLNPGLETVTIRNLEAREAFVRFRVELDSNGDQIIDHISYTGVQGWTESAMELGTRTYNNPYQHEAVFTGTVDATGGVTGQTLHFVTSAGTMDLGTLLAPGASYYIEVTAGPNEGQRFDVVSATGSALTLATVSDVCSDTPPFNTLAGVLPANIAGNRVALHRHWILGELFPITRFSAANASADADQVQTSVVAATSTYWLYANGGQPKWVMLGDATLADQANTVIAPGHGMFVTKRGIAAPLLACGEVRANNFMRPLCAGLNLVGGGYPIIQSATGPGSRQMDVAHGFFGSTDHLTADSFSVWKGDALPGASGYDSYYLYNPGTAPKWVKTGDATLAAHDAELLFLGDRSVLVQVKNDVHGYTIPNQSPVPLLSSLNAVTQSAATMQSLAAIGSGQDAASALIAHAFGLDTPGAGALPQGKLVGDNYVIEFTEPTGVTGITYGAEYSSTLLPGSWTEVSDSGTGAEHIFSVPLSGGNMFMRLRVTGQ